VTSAQKKSIRIKVKLVSRSLASIVAVSATAATITTTSALSKTPLPHPQEERSHQPQAASNQHHRVYSQGLWCWHYPSACEARW